MQNKVTKILVACIIIGLLIIAIVLLSMSFKKVDSDEVALKYDTYNRILYDGLYYQGLHVGPPGFTFIKFPRVYNTYKIRNLRCLNIDGVEVYIDLMFQYRVKLGDLKKIILQFEDFDGYKKVMYTIGEAAVHDVCSRFNLSRIQSDRVEFSRDVKIRAEERYNTISCEISDLQVQDYRRPERYEKAVSDKETSREDVELAKEERPRQLTEAQTKKMKAETQAEITIQKAESDAKIIYNRARAKAESILQEFYEETATYKKLMSSEGLDMNVEEFLAYMGVRNVDDSKKDVYIGLKQPAKLSYTPNS